MMGGMFLNSLTERFVQLVEKMGRRIAPLMVIVSVLNDRQNCSIPFYNQFAETS